MTMVRLESLQKWGVFLGLALISTLLALWLAGTHFFQVVELKTLDYRFRNLPEQETASQEIVLAEIDDNSIKHLEPVFGRWPWRRDAHAYFLNFMQRAGARLVAYDVLFLERDVENPEGDLAFGEETEETERIVHSLFLGDQDNEALTGGVDPDLLSRHSIPGSFDFLNFIQLDAPIPPLARHADRLGHVANALDADGPFRHYLIMASHRDRSIPSFALASAMLDRGIGMDQLEVEGKQVRAGPLLVPLNENDRIPIWFNGPPGTYRSFSYSHVVYSELQIQEGFKPGLNPGIFRDKIVLIGVTATGLHDLFTTPYAGSAGPGGGERRGKMSGVEVHANVVDNLLHSRYLRGTAPWLGWLSTFLMALLVILIISGSRLWLAIVGCVTLVVGFGWIAQAWFAYRWNLPVTPVGLSWAAAMTLGFVHQYWIEGAEKRKVKSIFSRYVPRDVYDQLLVDPEAVRLGGKRTLVTVLFSDLRGFTSLSEHRPPEDIVAQLNEYFSAMVEIVFEHQGTIDKFVGDMIMALFNTPLSDPDHADHAVQCALAMQERLRELNSEWAERGLPQLASGVGINSGEMIAGNVGSESIQSYTVIGDHVNLGARLESLCKEYGATIIISEFTRGLLRGEYALRELGEVTVKGRSQTVEIWQVEGE